MAWDQWLHLVGLTTLALYSFVLVAGGLGLVSSGTRFRPGQLLLRAHQCGRVGMLLLATLSLFGETGRGEHFLWVGAALDIVASPFSALHIVARLVVVLVVSGLLVSSTILSHVPVLGSVSTAAAGVEATRCGADGCLNGVVFLLHVVPAIAAEALLLLTALISILYLVVSALLRSRKVEVLTARFPSLSKLEKLRAKCAVIGLFLMSIAMIGGILSAVSGGQVPNFLADWTQTVAVVVWVVLATMVAAKRFFVWSDRVYAALSLVGAVLVVIVSWFGLLFGWGWHHTPWFGA